MIPDHADSKIVKPNQQPFAWKKDAAWSKLENDFKQAKALSDSVNAPLILQLLATERNRLVKINSENLPVTDTAYQLLLADFFSLSAQVAACPDYLDSLLNLYNSIRIGIKEKSIHWNINELPVRNAIYQQLYGMRAAVEEVLLQTDSAKYSNTLFVKNELSVTPTAKIFGIEVHSGDLLVSRGGAEVSALISRGNDYPANFSHVALIYVDDQSGVPYLIEAHIEKGVAIATVEEYEKDKKLRFMVLRVRADLPAMLLNNRLPQTAARFAFEYAGKKHIPYDFKMNFNDSTALFCSEVASYAYKHMGIQLWQHPSTISSKGVMNWLHDFGVENFVTQMPGDLEYDPQLSVVAEWRNKETLFKDHIDNAVMDVMLEQADSGKQIGYNICMLPLVRVLKGWCLVKNFFGRVGMIPEGMSATQALKNQYFIEMYTRHKVKTTLLVEQFIEKNHFIPPYWQLIKLSRSALNN